MKKRVLSLCIAMLAASASGAVWAQNGAAQAHHSGQSATPAAKQHLPHSADISDAQVNEFAQAEKKVQAIKASYRRKFEAQSKDPKKAMSVRREAQQKMVKAVKDSGLQVRQYNQIARASQHDTKLRKRIKSAE